jgi:glycosyltransferase involved in cell wall biosynthesis
MVKPMSTSARKAWCGVIDSEFGPAERLATSVAGKSSMMLSIVMPTFNEGPTLVAAIHQVLDITFPCPIELIVVDDGSTDKTAAILASVHDPRVVIHRHAINSGKGAAVRTGISLASGTHVVPFDADLEYSPQDLVALLEPVITGRTDIVYGPRLFGTNTVYQSYRYAMGNKLSTFVANVLFDSYISDLHTCLKLLPLPLARGMQLRERGFGFDTEVTAELLRLGYRPFEVPVSYLSRTRSQGKKLDWRDGLSCMGILLRVRSRGWGSRHKQVQRNEWAGELQLLASSGP